MTIGLPEALLYYRFGSLWEAFFRELGYDIVTSGGTSREILKNGLESAVDESCLPVKIYMGHVKALIGRCDYILVPRFSDFGRGEELCVRFQGLYDAIRNTYPDAPLISYNLQSRKGPGQRAGFLRMGMALGKSPARSLKAYETALLEQERRDARLRREQSRLLESKLPKVLISAQPYLIYDAYVGGPIIDMLAGQGCVPVFSDCCDRAICRARSKEISKTLYWTMNKETVGAIPLCKSRIDGVILLTSFPCGTGCLVNELVTRRVRDIPIMQLVLDEHQGEAGLLTRLESFTDIILERRRNDAG